MINLTHLIVLQQTYEVDAIIISPTLQLRKQRRIEVNYLAQEHIAQPLKQGFECGKPGCCGIRDFNCPDLLSLPHTTAPDLNHWPIRVFAHSCGT